MGEKAALENYVYFLATLFLTRECQTLPHEAAFLISYRELTFIIPQEITKK